jgi:hypothetical protein
MAGAGEGKGLENFVLQPPSPAPSLPGGTEKRRDLNVVAGEVKGLEKKMGGVLASTVSYFSIQLSDTLSTASRSKKAGFAINPNNCWGGC